MPPRTRSRRKAEEADPDFEDSEAEVQKRRKVVDSDSESEDSDDYLPADKTRRSVVKSLEQIFLKLVSKATENGTLQTGTNVEDYSRSLACEIENSFYDAHAQKRGDVGQRYRDRFRSLNFNLRNDKNESLQRQIITRELSPSECAHLTTEQMLNPELRKLADEVRKESIRESVLKQDTAPRVRKTHKGEEVVELEDDTVNDNDEPLPVATPIVPAKTDLDPVMSNNVPRNQIQADLARTGQTSEFASFSPPASPSVSSGEEGEEEEQGIQEEKQNVGDERPPSRVVWKGNISLGDRISCLATAIHLTGPSDWSTVFDLEKPLEIVGKVKEAEAYSYLEKSPRKSACLAIVSEDRNALNDLSRYLRERSCVGALGNLKWPTRDAYLMNEPPQLNDEAKYTLDHLKQVNPSILIAVFTVTK